MTWVTCLVVEEDGRGEEGGDHREKDTNFVHALIAANLVDPILIRRRLADLPAHHQILGHRAAAWLDALIPDP